MGRSLPAAPLLRAQCVTGMACLLRPLQTLEEITCEMQAIAELTRQLWQRRTGKCTVMYSQKKRHSVKVTVGLKKGALTKGGHGAPRDAGNSITVMLPTFVARESKTIASLLSGEHSLGLNRGAEEDFMECVGPLNRAAIIFPAIVSLMKLRWMIRLHRALVSLDPRLGLQRVVTAILRDTCSRTPWQRVPADTAEKMTDMIRSKLGSQWPSFVHWVEHFDNEPQALSTDGADVTRRNGLMDTMISQTSVSEATYNVSGFKPVPSVSSLWQVCDDIFIAFLMQQDAEKMPTALVLAEIDWFGLTRPKLQADFWALEAWSYGKEASRWSCVFAAQRQAHHLALALDVVPSWPFQEMTLEDIFDYASEIIAHPGTFSGGLLARIFHGVDTARRNQGDIGLRPMTAGSGHGPMQDTVTSLSKLETASLTSRMAEEVEADSLSKFYSYAASPRDKGALPPLRIGGLKDKAAPWLLGTSARFHASAAAWPGRAPPPNPFAALSAPATARLLSSRGSS